MSERAMEMLISYYQLSKRRVDIGYGNVTRGRIGNPTFVGPGIGRDHIRGRGREAERKEKNDMGQKARRGQEARSKTV